MLAKVWTLAVAAAIAGALALPAPAAYAQSTSAPNPAATHMNRDVPRIPLTRATLPRGPAPARRLGRFPLGISPARGIRLPEVAARLVTP